MFALVLLAGNTAQTQDSGQTATQRLTIVVLSGTQVWGYDGNTKKMFAYQFLANGVFTKSVEGWVGDRFVSHRDDNGATVSVKSTGESSVQWTIESADRSSTVYEYCARSV